MDRPKEIFVEPPVRPFKEKKGEGVIVNKPVKNTKNFLLRFPRMRTKNTHKFLKDRVTQGGSELGVDNRSIGAQVRNINDRVLEEFVNVRGDNPQKIIPTAIKGSEEPRRYGRGAPARRG